MKKSSMAGVVAALAGGAAFVAAPSARAALPNCNSFPNPIYISGGTATQAYIENAAVSIGSSVTLIYQGVDGCIGLSDVLTNAQESFSAYALSPTTPGTLTQCDPTNGTTTTGNYIDIGVSPAFPVSCTGSALPKGYTDWPGVIGDYAFVVPIAQTAQPSISAEAAYMVFGWAGQGGASNTVAPWTDPTQMFIRAPTSGTEVVLGIAIGLPSSKWLAQSPIEAGLPQQYSSAGKLEAALAASTSPAAIGILGNSTIDQNRVAVRQLAFQAQDPFTKKDQECGYLPDSDSTHFDKINVRQGRYEIWGPFHNVTNVNSAGKPILNTHNSGNAGAQAKLQTVLDYLTIDANLTTAEAQVAITSTGPTSGTRPVGSYVIPPCAMEVGRTSDTGAEASFQPKGACGCYYESLFGATVSSYCKTCTTSTDCKDPTYKTCNYGFCEAQ